MKYIYCGEANVNRQHLDEFIRIAKSLQVKGLSDDQNPQYSECQPMNLSFSNNQMASEPNICDFQYQSTSASIRAQTPVNMNKTSFPIYPGARFYVLERDNIDENVPETKMDTNVSDEIYDDQKDLISEPVKDGLESGKSIKRTASYTCAPKRKRVKRNGDKKNSIDGVGS